MTLVIEEEAEFSFSFDEKKLAREVFSAALEAENFPFEAEASLFLVTAAEIQQINRDHRDMDVPTDVLSFPLISYDAAGDFSNIAEDGDNFNPDTKEAMLGDIVLCVDKVEEQAKRYGHSQEREFAFLILHSVLHLLGYDHMEENEAAVMEQKQNDILAQMGILR